MLLAIDGLRVAILLVVLRDILPTLMGHHGIALGLLCKELSERLGWPGTSDISMIYRGQEMKNSQLERRLSVMEYRYKIDHVRNEAA